MGMRTGTRQKRVMAGVLAAAVYLSTAGVLELSRERTDKGWIRDPFEGASAASPAAAAVVRDDAGARQAFLSVADVWQHPRCMNCHPAGEAPLQYDDGRPHVMNVKRGADGLGKAAMRCSNCHGVQNLLGAHLPPGAPNWHLPPPGTPMVFEGRAAGEICHTLKDPAQNGHKTIEGIVHHVSVDPLVLWGWDPGEGREPVSRPHHEFAAKMAEWAAKGAACPD